MSKLHSSAFADKHERWDDTSHSTNGHVAGGSEAWNGTSHANDRHGYVFENVPQGLRDVPQWGVWRREYQGDKKKHVPYDAKTGNYLSVTDPETWSTYEVTLTTYGRGWCRQCDWRGDAIQLLRDRDGFSFPEAQRALGLDAPTSPAAKRTVTIHSFALKVAERENNAWQRRIFNGLIAQYRELSTKCDISAVGYRAIVRCPDLYTPAERSFWAHRLAERYERIAVLENDLARDLNGYTLGDALDIFTLKSRETDRVVLWRESEVRHV
jgi:hypothetical protein